MPGTLLEIVASLDMTILGVTVPQDLLTILIIILVVAVAFKLLKLAVKTAIILGLILIGIYFAISILG